MTVTLGNQLVECQECHNLYHQDCHKPQVTDKEVNDPRLVWYCARCTRQMKRMVRNNPKFVNIYILSSLATCVYCHFEGSNGVFLFTNILFSH